MNKQELKSKHPDVYADILAEGAASEQDRVASWEAYREADSKAVSEGIASGKAITNAEAHKFQATLALKGKVSDLQADSVAPVVTPQSTTVETSPEAKAIADKNAEIKAAFDFELK